MMNKEAIHHSVPVNALNSQIQVVGDLFKELDEVKTLATNNFDRSHINQLSTKSQPPMPSSSDILLNINNHRNLA